MRSAGLFLLGLAVIGGHVLDDSFVQPQPGTSAGDHLVGGLAPLAALALAAWAYPRLRGGHGYGVLLFDRRGQGESECDPHGFGWEGEKDIKAGIALLQRRPDVDRERIGGLGLSVGGELMLHAAAETEALKAVVSEGAGSRSVGEYREMRDAPLPMHAVETMISAGLTIFSNSPPPPLMQDVIGRIAPRPVFLIWAPRGVDTEVLNPEYFKSAGEPKTLWEIPESRHVGGLAARPAEYERRVVAFFDKALL